ncbi:MAG: DegT/DnrJ/EryC1/StrS family aminotransferase [Bryobacteraceae bacterium]
MSPPVRFQTSRPVLAGKELEYVADAVRTGWISGQGSYITDFESAVSRYLHLDGGIAVSSGTAALHLALAALGAGPGMDVIVPSFTYVACANAVTYCRATPVFADCDRTTRNLTRESIEASITPNTRGVLLVHLFGLPAPVEDVRRFCDEKGLWLIEDCAQCFGGTAADRFAGQFGDMTVFSFYGNKIISTGEGGMVFARDTERRGLIRCLRNQGLDPTRHHWHPYLGFNYRMTNLAAAIGCGQMEMADYHIQERRRVAARYRMNLLHLQQKRLLMLPVNPPSVCSVYWLYSFVLTAGGEREKERVRDIVLEEHGIQTRPFYIPLHLLPAHRRARTFPQAEFLGEHGIVLPTYSGLSDEEIDEISEATANVVLRVFS